jgi:stage V sporulation protein G
MTITEVKVHPVDQEKLKAYVSIVLDDCFLVSDIKVISGPAGLFVSMPSKRKKTGEFKDVAHPLNRETRQWMEEKILGEYERTLHSRPEPSAQAEQEVPS